MEEYHLLKASYEELAAFIAELPEETNTLEFKRKTTPSLIELQKEDRKLLGETLSGFANATGGVLVLGVSTEKHQHLDRAKAIDPIANVKKVAARVRSYTNECVAPVVEGVRIRSVQSEDGSGMILVSVPRGQARPHMSTAPGHHTYYRRVMDSFVPMEAYEVEEMMRLKTEPQLQFVYEIRPAGSIGANRNFVLLFGLENVSAVTAKFPYISYRYAQNQPTVSQYGDLWPRYSDVATYSVLLAAGADQVLHPGQKLYVAKLDYNETFDPRFRDWGVSSLETGATLNLEFQFGCEDCPMQAAKLTLERDELLAP